MRPGILTLLIALTFAACGGAATADIEVVSPADAAAFLDDHSDEVVLLDVRTPEEYREIRVPGSINIDFYAADFASQLDALPKDVPYVVYCRSGNRSSQAVDIMADLGFTEVLDVDGGIVSWSEAGLPLES